MDRRKFLRWGGFITTTPVLGSAAGCGGGRRHETVDPAIPATDLARGADWKFPQSVASGDPGPDSVLLWARIVPASGDDVVSAGAVGDFSVGLRVSAADNSGLLGTDAALLGTPVLDTPVPVQALWDHTVRNRVTGLAPGATYYYQFMAGSVRSRVGCFKTAPAPDADVAELKFAFMACQDRGANHWGALVDLAAQPLDFVVHLGDYIYETVEVPATPDVREACHAPLRLPDGIDRPGATGVRCAASLADYRTLYKTYRTDPRLQAVHERFAMVATWDDHEFSDDCWQDAETYDNGSYSPAAGGDNTHQPARRRHASQAWFEFMPADIALDTTTDGIHTLRLYRDLRFGRLAHLVMTDDRLYRDDHAIAEALPRPDTGQPLGPVGSRYLVPQPLFTVQQAARQVAAAASGSGAADALAGVSMLGRAQREWWQQTMLGSPATWKLWGNGVPLLRLGLDGSKAVALLFAWQAVPGLSARIEAEAASARLSLPMAAAVVGAMVAGAQAVAALQCAKAIAAGGAQVPASAGVSARQAYVALCAFQAAAAAATAGDQADAGAASIAAVCIRPEVEREQADSRFLAEAGLADALAPYFAPLLFNCDEWDGYDAERKQLMGFLRDHSIRNVVGLSGDIHAFLAGSVSDDFDAAGGGQAVMVELVTAGISSASLFSVFDAALAGLPALMAHLVRYPVTLSPPGLGAITLHLNLLDYTLGRPQPTLAQLVSSQAVPLRAALARAGAAEASLDATVAELLVDLAADPAFGGPVLSLVGQLSALGGNPWLKLVESQAQGYALVTLTPERLMCEFRRVNPVVAGQAPVLSPMAAGVTATVLRDTAGVRVG